MAGLTGRSLIACDLRGHGQSTAQSDQYNVELLGSDVGALLQTLNPRSTAVLIGHSLGCRVVLQAYLEAPNLVAGLVLVDGSWTPPGELARATQAVQDRMNSQGYAAFVRHIFEHMFLDNCDVALRQRIVDEALALPAFVGKPLFLHTMEWDALRMEAALARVAVPLLILQSTVVIGDRARVMLTSDESTPWLDLVRRRVPTADIRSITGVGHFSMLEASNRINEALEAFMHSLASSP